MQSLERFSKIEKRQSVLLIVLLLWFTLGLNGILEDKMIGIILIGAIILAFSIAVITQSVRAKKNRKLGIQDFGFTDSGAQRKWTHNTTPKVFWHLPILFYGELDVNRYRLNLSQKLLAWAAFLFVAYCYYGDLSQMWSMGMVLAHGLVFTLLIACEVYCSKVLRKHNAVFFEDGVWTRGDFLKYESVKRFQLIPLKHCIRLEVNTGSVYLAFNLTRAQSEQIRLKLNSQ